MLRKDKIFDSYINTHCMIIINTHKVKVNTSCKCLLYQNFMDYTPLVNNRLFDIIEWKTTTKQISEMVDQFLMMSLF